MWQKQEILSRESGASKKEDELTAQRDSVGNPMPRHALMIKQRILEESTASTVPANSSHIYSTELGLSQVEMMKQQNMYRAVTLQQNDGNEVVSVEDGPYAYIDNILGLLQSETWRW